MGWNPQVLFAAFKTAGMLKQARLSPASTAPAEFDFDCNLKRPELLVLGDQQQSAELVIEYETASVRRIRKGDPITIDNTRYVARAHAITLGDGTYSQVELET